MLNSSESLRAITTEYRRDLFLSHNIKNNTMYTILLDISDAWSLKDAINSQQYARGCNSWNCNGEVSVLFNKGRYFEMSYYDKTVLELVSEEVNVPIEYGNSLVGGKDKLEHLVAAFNTLGFHVKITLDWI